MVAGLPPASIVALPGPVVYSASKEPRVTNTEPIRLAQFKDSIAIVVCFLVHVKVGHRAGPHDP